MRRARSCSRGLPGSSFAASLARRCCDGAHDKRAQLFVTCVVDSSSRRWERRSSAFSARWTSRSSSIRRRRVADQPAFNSGYWDDARPVARRLLGRLDPDTPVVVPSGSCAAMIRNYYHELFADDPVNLARARRLGANVFEFTEYLNAIAGADRLGEIAGAGESPETDATNAPIYKVAFHEACHAKRELGIDAQPKALLDSLPQVSRVEMTQAEVCCGFGGTFSVKFPDISGAMLSDKLDNIEASGADVVTACDASCLMHIGGGLRRRESGG